MGPLSVVHWDKLSMYGQDALHQLAFVAGETLVESFCPWSIRMQVDGVLY